MPDIMYLPVLAEYFGVSIDQLMGLVPLEGEEYIAEKTGTGKFWENKMEYLLRTRKSAWNSDYMHFLIEQVWKIDRPEIFLKKMIEFAKKDAYVVCIDSNREFECDGLYIDGMDYFWLCKHDGMDKHWKTELEQQGKDDSFFDDTWYVEKRSFGILQS